MFRWRDLWALFQVNLREYLRDPLAAGFAFAFPLFFLVVFGVTSRTAEARLSDVAVVVAASDAAGANLAAILEREPSLRIRRVADGQAALDGLQAKDLDAVVELASEPSIVVRADGQRFGKWLSERIELGEHQARHPAAGIRPPPVRTLAGAQRNPFDFIAPGVFALALLQLGLYGTGNQVLAARSRGALRRLRLTPLSEQAIIGSHVLVRLLVAAAQIALLAGVARMMFGFEVQGGLGAILLASLTGALALTLMGYAIGGIAPTLQSGSMLLMLANFAMMFAGQVFFDLRQSLPGQVLSYLNPVSLVSDSFRFAITGEAQAHPFWMNQVFVCLWAAALLLITLKFFKHSMDNL